MIKAKQVRSLRNRTDAGYVLCMQALIQANGDEDRAIEVIERHATEKFPKNRRKRKTRSTGD